MFRHILYATDGSSAAELAGDYAASLAIRFNSKITVLHAYTRLPVSQVEHAFPNIDSYASQEDAEILAAQSVDRLRKMGVLDVEAKVLVGQPSSVILGVAESIKPDVIVIGARGLSTWQGLLLGSVSISIAHRSEVPVLIVK
jgi:nucleotide-binding universal stress UspA family protein